MKQVKLITAPELLRLVEQQCDESITNMVKRVGVGAKVWFLTATHICYKEWEETNHDTN